MDRHNRSERTDSAKKRRKEILKEYNLLMSRSEKSRERAGAEARRCLLTQKRGIFGNGGWGWRDTK